MHNDHQAGIRSHKPYLRLLAMAVLSFIAMYVLMYAMVDRPTNIHNNLNQAYMAALMAAPMVVIELALMGSMYPRRSLNAAILAASALVFIGAFAAIRAQAAIGDKQFLQSMIPHHASAILMCERAQIRDAEIAQLCRDIEAGQQGEIDQMNTILRRL